jgi:hypothetical protein
MTRIEREKETLWHMIALYVSTRRATRNYVTIAGVCGNMPAGGWNIAVTEMEKAPARIARRTVTPWPFGRRSGP